MHRFDTRIGWKENRTFWNYEFERLELQWMELQNPERKQTKNLSFEELDIK